MLGRVTCFTQQKSWIVTSCLILHNNIYVITSKVEIGVLEFHSSSLKFLNLKNTPTTNSLFLDFRVKREMEGYERVLKRVESNIIW